jgi:hypothetical protein
MNRAEARIKNFQNSNSQLKPSKDMSLGNSGMLSFLSHKKAYMDECDLARNMGRKKKRK